LAATGTTGVATCAASYTPSSAGSQSITASYQGDSTHSTSTSTGFSLTVTSNTVTVTNPGGQSSTVGQAASLQVVASDSDSSQTMSYSATGLPSGLSINSSTGLISGIPTAAASASVTVSAKDSTGASGSATFTWTVGDGVLTVASQPAVPPPSGTPGGMRPGCPAPTGQIRGATLGLAKLGMTRSQARQAYYRSSVRPSSNVDLFCLTPSGVRVGYATTKLLASLSARQRRQLRGRVTWITTANPFFTVEAIHAGARLARGSAVLRHAVGFTVAGRHWYFVRKRRATLFLVVHDGVVQEVGIVSNLLTRSKRMDGTVARVLA
jgi:hypothetical protein